MNVDTKRMDTAVPVVALPDGSDSPATEASARCLIIEPPGRWPDLGLAELWSYRGLFFFLVWSGVKSRYAQSILGPVWAILNPVITMVVFTVIFGMLVRVPSDGVPYAVFSFAALVPWGYFSGAFSGASGSLVGNSKLFTKVYFPRLVLPWTPVFAGLVNFTISFAIMLALAGAYGFVPSASALVVVPLLILIMMMTAAGLGSALAAVIVQYRDVRMVNEFLLRGWMYATPVVYPLSMVPESYRTLYMLNPMVGVVEGFRSVILGTNPVPWTAIGIAFGVASAVLVAGLFYFRRVETIFADVV